MVTALVVATTGVAASAASGTENDSVSCVDQEESTSEAGTRGQRGYLAEQHRQEVGDPQTFGEETSVFTLPQDYGC